MALIVNENSFASVADADTYLANSSRATNWAFSETVTKERALISATRIAEKQCWQGTKAALVRCTAVVLVGGGTGYVVDDLITAVGGTTDIATILKVTAVSGGVITTVSIFDAGAYTTAPTNPVSVTGGTGGDDATFTLTYATQVLRFPRTALTDREGLAAGATTVPTSFLSGLYELAFDISVDPSVEAEGDKAQKEKVLKAGSAQVQYFGDDTNKAIDRFDTQVQEWWDEWLCGETGIPTADSGTLASGTDVCSEFDDADKFGLSDGYS